MFARVTHARFPPELHAAGRRVVLEDLLPALRQAPGYRGCVLLADGKPGSCLTLVLWETEEAADDAAADRVVAAAYVKLVSGGMAIESRKIFKVVTHDEVRRRT